MNPTLLITIFSDIVTYAPQAVSLVENGIKAEEAINTAAPNLIPNLEKLIGQIFPDLDAALTASSVATGALNAAVSVRTAPFNPAVPR